MEDALTLSFIEDTGINELMVASHIYDMEAKLKSFSILKDALSLK